MQAAAGRAADADDVDGVAGYFQRGRSVEHGSLQACQLLDGLALHGHAEDERGDLGVAGLAGQDGAQHRTALLAAEILLGVQGTEDRRPAALLSEACHGAAEAAGRTASPLVLMNAQAMLMEAPSAAAVRSCIGCDSTLAGTAGTADSDAHRHREACSDTARDDTASSSGQAPERFVRFRGPACRRVRATSAQRPRAPRQRHPRGGHGRLRRAGR